MKSWLLTPLGAGNSRSNGMVLCFAELVDEGAVAMITRGHGPDSDT